MAEIEEALAELHSVLDMKQLNPAWAKAEIFLGLAAASAGLLVAIRAPSFSAVEVDWMSTIVSLALMVFGSYLAMAGHRSHLYQSNNKLAAYLVERVSGKAD